MRNAKPTVAYIVRHAEKTGETPNADLSPKGIRRAETLKWMLHDIAFDAIYATRVPRTLHTVEPIARANGLTVEHYDPGPGVFADTLGNLAGGRTILVAGHSDTIPLLLKSLGVPIQDRILPGFDDLFILTMGGSSGTAKATTLQRLHYPGTR